MTISAVSLGLLGAVGEEVHAESTEENSEIQTSETNTLSTEERNNLHSFLEKYGVDSNTQYELITKWENGEVWDSLKENEEPVDVYRNDTTSETVYTYSDGSVAIMSIDPGEVTEVPAEKDNSGITPLSVDPGDVTSGSGYVVHSGSRVYKHAGIMNASFLADFTLVQRGNDRIDRVYDYTVTTSGGVSSSETLTTDRAEENANGPAEATLQFQFQVTGGIGSTTLRLRLHVGDDNYYTTDNFNLIDQIS